MLHAISTWWLLVRAGARSEMQYKLDFFAQVIGLILMYGAQFANIVFIVLRFKSIGDWYLGDLAVLYGLVGLCTGLSYMFFFHFTELGWIITRGEFDRFLLRPVNPFTLYMGNKFNASNWGHLSLGVAIFFWALWQAGVQWTFWKVVYVLLAVTGGTLILGSFIVLVGTLSFWFFQTGVLVYTVLMPARELVTYPISVFPRGFQFLLTFIVPFAFINFFPAHVLLDRHDTLFHPLLAWGTPLVGLICFAAAYGLWSWGLTKYQGAGS